MDIIKTLVAFLQTLWRRTPLAWLQVTRERTRLLVAMAGIAFANVLMFVQLGFLSSLTVSNTAIYRSLDADLAIVDAQFNTLLSVRSISRDRLYQALSSVDVESISPISITTVGFRNPETRVSRSILVIGVNPALPSFRPEAVPSLQPLKLADRMLFDRASRPEYGPIAEVFARGEKPLTEVGGVPLQVDGLFSIGTSFAADGNIIVSETAFYRILPDRPPGQIDVGLVKLKPGADPAGVQRELSARLGEDVVVLTMAEFGQREADYWTNGTGVGFIFGQGAVVGFIVGAVIVYQILYADVSDHLAEYATLKAMGYGDRFLMGILVQESLLLSVLGFVPGVLFSLGLYAIAWLATGLPVAMTGERLVLVFVLTVVMCTGSAFLAARKLREADPADIF